MDNATPYQVARANWLDARKKYQGSPLGTEGAAIYERERLAFRAAKAEYQAEHAAAKGD